MAIPSSLKEEEAGGGEGVPERHEDPELLLAPGDTDERPPHAPVHKRTALIMAMISRIQLVHIWNV